MSRMLWVAAGLAVLLAAVFGGIYALPQKKATPAAGGKAVAFNKALAGKGSQLASSNGCTACHSVDGATGAGPTWKGTFGTQIDIGGGKKVPMNAAYIKTSILDPNAQVAAGFGPSMPSFKGKLSDADIAAVVEYIKSLSG